VIGGYSRMLGDAKRSPYTSIRGSADQWFAAVGIGYTF
jgi:outer membrane scaffolding protein for murein synthesis (MipA/OmpV family)